MSFFKSRKKEYKRMFEEQLKSTADAIKIAEEWKKLSIEQKESMEKMSKSLDDSIVFIKKLQIENKKLTWLLYSVKR